MANPIPARAQDAMSGSEFIRTITSVLGDTQKVSATELEARRSRVEDMVFEEIARGNVPDFMRPENWPTVTVESTIAGRTVQARVRVCPDYLAIGSNTDFVRMPINPLTAQRIADRFGLALPTPRMVDVIDAQARSTKSTDSDGHEHTGMIPFIAAPSIAARMKIKWDVQHYGFWEGRWMLSGEFIEMQNRMIQEAVDAAGTPSFRSGQKKDIVYDPIALQESGEGGPPVVIYRKGIQPLSNIHNERYWDYSHGIRFLDATVQLTITESDGTSRTETRSMRDILRDRRREQGASDVDRNLYQLFAPAPMDIGQMYRHVTVVPRKTGQLTEPPIPREGRRQEPQQLA